MECNDRTKRSSVMLPYTFLPTMPARKLRDVVNKIPSQKAVAFPVFPHPLISSTAWYRLAYSSNFSGILEPIIENNYQLFMVERLIMQGARTFVKTMKEFDNDLALCDDTKKNTKVWQEPVIGFEISGSIRVFEN